MHHTLFKAEWLDQLNQELNKRGLKMELQFDQHMVLVENDWAMGYEPEDVAARIMAGEHRYIQVKRETINTTESHAG